MDSNLTFCQKFSIFSLLRMWLASIEARSISNAPIKPALKVISREKLRLLFRSTAGNSIESFLNRAKLSNRSVQGKESNAERYSSGTLVRFWFCQKTYIQKRTRDFVVFRFVALSPIYSFSMPCILGHPRVQTRYSINMIILMSPDFSWLLEVSSWHRSVTAPSQRTHPTGWDWLLNAGDEQEWIKSLVCSSEKFYRALIRKVQNFDLEFQTEILHGGYV